MKEDRSDQSVRSRFWLLYLVVSATCFCSVCGMLCKCGGG